MKQKNIEAKFLDSAIEEKKSVKHVFATNSIRTYFMNISFKTNYRS